MTNRAARIAAQKVVVDMSVGQANAIRVYPTGEWDEDGNVFYREEPDGDVVYNHHSALEFCI